MPVLPVVLPSFINHSNIFTPVNIIASSAASVMAICMHNSNNGNYRKNKKLAQLIVSYALTITRILHLSGAITSEQVMKMLTLKRYCLNGINKL